MLAFGFINRCLYYQIYEKKTTQKHYTLPFLLFWISLKKKKTGLKIAGRFFRARWEWLDAPLVEKPEARRGGITPGLLIRNWLVTHCLVPHSGISVIFRGSLRPLERAASPLMSPERRHQSVRRSLEQKATKVTVMMKMAIDVPYQ